LSPRSGLYLGELTLEIGDLLFVFGRLGFPRRSRLCRPGGNLFCLSGVAFEPPDRPVRPDGTSDHSGRGKHRGR